MAKHLGEPLIVTEAVIADRYDISAYRVEVDGPSVDIEYTCGRTNEDASITSVAERTKHVAAGSALDAAMATATANIVSAVLAVGVANNLVSAQEAAALTAALSQNPSLASEAYYAGTRDALYGLL